VRYLQLLALPVISIGAFSMIGCDARSGGVDIWNAVAADNIDDVRVFAQSGGNLNQKNASGETVLMHALKKGSLASYGELLALGADPNIPMSDGRTITAWAISKKETDWLRLALEHKADPNMLSMSRASKFDLPPLRFATSSGTLAHAKLLVEYGADVNYLNAAKQRPLIFAMGMGRYDVVILLLDAGADFNAADTEPHSFLDEVRRLSEDKESLLVVPKLRQQFEEVEAWLNTHGVKI
jgi:uncharacterized protein